MTKSKEYKAVKNFLHNELQISKEMIVDIVKAELEPAFIKVLHNTYGATSIRNIVRNLLREEIIGNRCDFYRTLEHEVGKELERILKEEFKVVLVQKTNQDNDINNNDLPK